MARRSPDPGEEILKLVIFLVAIIIFTGGSAAFFKSAMAIVIPLGLLAFVGFLGWIFLKALRGSPPGQRQTLR